MKVSIQPVDYILDIFKSKDSSFYKCRELNQYSEFTKLEDKQELSDDFFVLKVYTDKFYVEINKYLIDKEIIENLEKKNSLLMPINHIKSIIYCLQESLKKNKNVKDGIIVYRGCDNKLPDDIGIGSKFYFNNFISTSIKEEEAKKFVGNIGSLLIIKIKNNKERNYCYDISMFSQFKSEKEILISSFCYYLVTGIERKKDGIDTVNLDCLGFVFDNLI